MPNLADQNLPPRGIIISLIIAASLILAVLIVASYQESPTTPYLSIKPSQDFAHQWELEPQPLRQTIYPPRDKLNKIGLALSPYGSEPAGEITITLRDHNNAPLHQAKIPASEIKTDQMIYLEDLNIIGLKGQKMVIEITSSLPSEESKLAARYTDADDQMPGSHIIREGNLLEGTLALELY